ncbi:MAG: DNA repair protein RecN [Pyrinomonadaceae bacterium]|nr:DNA repair protein RecN [Pyrinomonadaceae bacterium]
MLSLLKIKNIALIDSLEVEFGPGLNLLTGETGSGKSIIVDSLGALTGERVSGDLIKEGEDSARIEGLFSVGKARELREIFEESGVEIDDSPDAEVIVRRELSLAGKNRIFVNNQMVTAAFLKKVGPFLVDIHGQGEQASLFDPSSHLSMLDEFAAVADLKEETASAFTEWRAVRSELEELRSDEAEKLQLLDILRFQANEISKAALKAEEFDELEEEKRRLNNVEKLSALSDEAYTLMYESDASTITTFDQAFRKIEELAEYDSRFAEQLEGLQSARAIIEDASIMVRDFRNHLEFSPERLEEIETRLAEIARVTRKYGGTVETALEHLADAERRLENIESAELREKELQAALSAKRESYLKAAAVLSEKRRAAAAKFEKAVLGSLKAVALEKARFEVRIESFAEAEERFTPNGIDRVEFFFSANVGESPKPLSKVASGGEASRIMLILKTSAHPHRTGKTAIFDEIDTGIGGRVAEAVGAKLKELAATQQVLCVTHQAQVASKADRHFVVEKTMGKRSTSIAVRELNVGERVEEIARMLAGERITDAARENARELIAAA